MFGELASLHKAQSSVLARLSDLEKSVSLNQSSNNDNQNLLYFTIFEIQADSDVINEKSKRIACVGIDEQGDDVTTARFDREIVKEAAHTSEDEELIHEFDEGHIVEHRHPPGKSRGPGVRGRIIKISLRSL